MAGPGIGFATLQVIPSARNFKSNLNSELGGQVDQAGKEQGGRFSKAFGMASKAAMAGVGAAVGIGIKGLMDFTGFERQMNEVFTLLPGITKDAMGEMTDQVKDFSKEFGVLPDKVVPALYQSLSAGVPADNVFEFLETAQMAAKGGVTELTTAVDGISSVVNAYGSEVISAAEASDLMFTAVRLGKTNFEELSASLSNVTPISSALGVAFEDVTAGLAAMTAQGTPTAQATTQMRALFVELSKAGGAAATTFEDMAGKTFQEFIASGGNTADALGLMKKAAKESGVQLQDLFGSVEAGGAALSLTGSDAFVNNLDEMAGAAGATEAAFDQMNQGLGPILDRIKANVAVFFLDVGERLAPIVERVLSVAGQLFDVLFKGDFTGGPFSEDSKIIDIAFRIRDVFGEVMGIAKQAFDVLFRGDFTGGPFEEDSPFIGALFTVREVAGGVAAGLKAIAEEALTGLSNWWTTNGDSVVGGIRSIGEVINDPVIPAFESLVGWLKDEILPRLTDLAEWIKENDPVLVAFATTTLVVMAAKFWAWATAASAAAAATGAALAAAVAAGATFAFVAVIIGAFAGALYWTWENTNKLQDALLTLEQYLSNLWQWLNNVWDMLKNIYQAMDDVGDKIGEVTGPLGGVVDTMDRWGSTARDSLLGAIGIRGFDTGGIVPGYRGEPQLALVHGGETILPTHKQDFSMPTGVGGGAPVVGGDYVVQVLPGDDALRRGPQELRRLQYLGRN